MLPSHSHKPVNISVSSLHAQLKPPQDFLSRRAFLHMFAIIISWLVFIPAVHSPHGSACTTHAPGSAGNHSGGFTFLGGQESGWISKIVQRRAWNTLRLPCSFIHFRQSIWTVWICQILLGGNYVRPFIKDKTHTAASAHKVRSCGSWTHSFHSETSPCIKCNILVCLICFTCLHVKNPFSPLCCSKH